MGPARNEREWMIVAALAGVLSGVSLYGPWTDKAALIAFGIVTAAAAAWVAWRRPPDAPPLLGLFVLVCVMWLAMPLAGWALGGPGNLWGMVAMGGSVLATVVYLVTDRTRRV